MEKLDELAAGKTFKIVQRANGHEQLIFEAANRTYFRNLANKHLLPVCEIKNCVLKPYQVEMILTFRELPDIPEKYRHKLYLPLSNLFNSYAKSINKRYHRNGSLFRTRFEREEIKT